MLDDRFSRSWDKMGLKIVDTKNKMMVFNRKDRFDRLKGSYMTNIRRRKKGISAQYW